MYKIYVTHIAQFLEHPPACMNHIYIPWVCFNLIKKMFAHCYFSREIRIRKEFAHECRPFSQGLNISTSFLKIHFGIYAMNAKFGI